MQSIIGVVRSYQAEFHRRTGRIPSYFDTLYELDRLGVRVIMPPVAEEPRNLDPPDGTIGETAEQAFAAVRNDRQAQRLVDAAMALSLATSRAH